MDEELYGLVLKCSLRYGLGSFRLITPYLRSGFKLRWAVGSRIDCFRNVKIEAKDLEDLNTVRLYIKDIPHTGWGKICAGRVDVRKAEINPGIVNAYGEIWVSPKGFLRNLLDSDSGWKLIKQ